MQVSPAASDAAEPQQIGVTIFYVAYVAVEGPFCTPKTMSSSFCCSPLELGYEESKQMRGLWRVSKP
jgi:hypothetical protein